MTGETVCKHCNPQPLLCPWCKLEQAEEREKKLAEVITEISLPPYPDSDHGSLLKWCRARARAALKAWREAGGE